MSFIAMMKMAGGRRGIRDTSLRTGPSAMHTVLQTTSTTVFVPERLLEDSSLIALIGRMYVVYRHQSLGSRCVKKKSDNIM